MSSDGDWIYLHVVRRGLWSFFHFYVPEISKKKQDLWKTIFDEEREEAPPTKEITSDLGESWESLGVANQPLVDYWNLSAWWQRLPGVPRATCRVFLFCESEVWSIVQHYTTVDRVLSLNPFRITLHDPLLVNDLDEVKPMVGVCFNHLVLVELVDENGTGDEIVHRKRRVLRLVCFPEPDMETGSFVPTVSARDDPRIFKTLDVSSEILDEAHNLYIEQSLGSIVITTRDDKLYTVKYA